MTPNHCNLRRLALLCSAASMLAACATVPNLGERPQPASPQSFETARSFAAPAIAWPADRWWEAYGDTQLTALVDEALRDSPSLEIAAARVRQAEASAQVAGAALRPSVNGQASVTQTGRELTGNVPMAFQGGPSSWSTQASVGLQLSYQLDFFGRNRASLAAATSTADAARAEAASARLQLSTAVALAYAQLLRECADRTALEDAQRLRRTSADLVGRRQAAGLENQAQVEQANAELAQADADVVAARGAIMRTRNQLAALLGKGPDRGLDIAEPATPRITPIGLPATLGLDLIGRRPDLVAARLNAEAQAERINVARADFYPNVNLSAVLSLQSLGIGSLGSMGLAQFGPAISLPIFSGGRIEGQYRGARAAYDEAVAQYNASLTEALHEVADAIGDRRTAEAQLAEQRRALASAEAAYRLAQLRYRGGLASYMDTVQVESGLIQQRRAVAALEAQALALDITLVRALGGGFAAA